MKKNKKCYQENYQKNPPNPIFVETRKNSAKAGCGIRKMAIYQFIKKFRSHLISTLSFIGMIIWGVYFYKTMGYVCLYKIELITLSVMPITYALVIRTIPRWYPDHDLCICVYSWIGLFVIKIMINM